MPSEAVRLRSALAALRWRLKGDFREEDHPRADDGKFGEGSGGASGQSPGSSASAPSGKRTPKEGDPVHSYLEAFTDPSGEPATAEDARTANKEIKDEGGKFRLIPDGKGGWEARHIADILDDFGDHWAITTNPLTGLPDAGDLDYFREIKAKSGDDETRSYLHSFNDPGGDKVTEEDLATANRELAEGGSRYQIAWGEDLHLWVAEKRRKARGKSWSEQDHPRGDGGQWGQGTAGAGKKPVTLDKGSLPETADEAHGQAAEKARGWLKKLGGLPAATVSLAAGKAQKLYDKMAAKYGKGWARAIVSVGIVTFPTPFTTGAVLATIGLAKLCLKLSGTTPAQQKALRVLIRTLRGRLKGEDEGGESIDMATAFRRAQRFVAALASSLEAPDLDAGALRQLERVAESLGGEDVE